MTAVRNAHTDGLMSKAPSFTSMFRYLEDPSLTPILKHLIEQSSLPLKSIETGFAADSTGFATSVYDRWFAHKWGRELKKAKWVKAHVMCGVQTNIVTAVEVTEVHSNDAPHMIPFVETTARNFNVKEVSADKAYLSKKNLRAIQAVGGSAYIPFKSNSIGYDHQQPYDALWDRMFHLFNLNRADFLAHYHKRSNVETTMQMIKAKFGGAVRAKTPVAQVNEVLFKILCHNICVLIQSIYELGIAVAFEAKEPFGANQASAPKMVWE